jgi:hypothetical protein
MNELLFRWINPLSIKVTMKTTKQFLKQNKTEQITDLSLAPCISEWEIFQRQIKGWYEKTFRQCTLFKKVWSHVPIWIRYLEQFIGLVYANSLLKISYTLLSICVLSNIQYSGTCSVSSLESQKETFSTTHLNMHVSVIWTYWVKQDEQCFFLLSTLY